MLAYWDWSAVLTVVPAALASWAKQGDGYPGKKKKKGKKKMSPSNLQMAAGFITFYNLPVFKRTDVICAAGVSQSKQKM